MTAPTPKVQATNDLANEPPVNPYPALAAAVRHVADHPEEYDLAAPTHTSTVIDGSVVAPVFSVVLGWLDGLDRDDQPGPRGRYWYHLNATGQHYAGPLMDVIWALPRTDRRRWELADQTVMHHIAQVLDHRAARWRPPTTRDRIQVVGTR